MGRIRTWRDQHEAAITDGIVSPVFLIRYWYPPILTSSNDLQVLPVFLMQYRSLLSDPVAAGIHYLFQYATYVLLVLAL